MDSAYQQAVMRLNPVGYWALRSRGSDRDLSGDNHPAVYSLNGASPNYGGSSLVRSEPTGRTVTDLSGNSFYTVTSFAALNQSAFSVVAWWNSKYAAARQILVARDNTGDGRPFFWSVTADGKFQFIDAGSTTVFAGTRADLANGRNRMLGFNYAVNRLDFYCDGILDRSFTSGVAAPAASSSTDLVLRQHNTGADRVVGALGHVAYIPRLLSAEEWRTLAVIGHSEGSLA